MIDTILHDRWRILKPLGRGGMGEVYLAEHLALGRKEAIKILMPTLAKDPQFVSRFRREARAVNRLRHQNIIALYDFGQLPDQRFYLAMEYAEGESVYRLLKHADHFEVPRALHVLGQLAYAVHHAHSRGVVHRDLKPDNMILCGDDETLKVLDFGVAKIVASDHDESVALSTNNLVWGSPRYMAPERVRGVGDDPRSDLYAIGIIAFELLIGSPPFAGTSEEVIRGHLKVTPDPPSYWRRTLEIPEELDAVVMKAIAKSPNDRYQTAAELFAALSKVPGYPSPRIDARRRFVPSAQQPTQMDANNVRGVLRQVAEALLDRGVHDARLVTGIAQLRDHEQTLAELEAAQDALDHEATAVHETMGDREASLRFALSELQFAADQWVHRPDIATEIEALQSRLATVVANRERLEELEQRRTRVATDRAQGLARVKAAYDDLERIVEELLAPRGQDPTFATLAQRFEHVKGLRSTR